MKSRILGLFACSIAWIATASAFELQPASLRSFEATYGIEYSGRQAGTMTIGLSADSDRTTFIYSATTRWDGLFAQAMPGPIHERTEFTLVDGDLLPISYSLGETSGNDSEREILFDWKSGRAIVSAQGRTDFVALLPGMLDRASAFVALILNAPTPGTSWQKQVIDDAAISDYEYHCTGEVELETKLGRTTTLLVSQQRQGSSRQSLYWLAPTPGHPPYRIEQQKDGATEITFNLVSTTERKPTI